MGIYKCCCCDRFADSDDGCGECPLHSFGLRCLICEEEALINEEEED